MSQIAKRRRCGKEVLKILEVHQPLTLELLQKMIEPPISKKDLRQAMGYLRRRGLVDMLAGNSKFFYYQLSQSLPARKLVAKKIDGMVHDAPKTLLRRQDWYHNQWCEFWSLKIKRMFPGVDIVREHSVGSHEIAKNLLLSDGGSFELLPDFLVIFPEASSFPGLNIAFEIERTRKTDERILQKLRCYMNETRLDGVVYICDGGRLSETIRILFNEKAKHRATRVGHYVENFFLFSDAMSAGSISLENFWNALGDRMNFKDWCQKIYAMNFKYA